MNLIAKCTANPTFACAAIDRIAALSRRAHGGRSRFAKLTCGLYVARKVRVLENQLGTIKAVGQL